MRISLCEIDGKWTFLATSTEIVDAEDVEKVAEVARRHNRGEITLVPNESYDMDELLGEKENLRG